MYYSKNLAVYATQLIKNKRFYVKLRYDKTGLTVCVKKPWIIDPFTPNEHLNLLSELHYMYPHYPIRLEYVR